MPEGTTILNVLIQGGAVGVALAALWILYKKDQNQSQTINNQIQMFEKIAEDHRKTIDRNTDAWIKNTDVLSKINERIK